jgi:hypothetical protein
MDKREHEHKNDKGAPGQKPSGPAQHEEGKRHPASQRPDQDHGKQQSPPMRDDDRRRAETK